MHVSERGGEQVAPALPSAQDFGHAQQILGRRVEPPALDALVAHVVLTAADHPGLELEHDARPGALVQERGGDAQILLERQARSRRTSAS